MTRALSTFLFIVFSFYYATPGIADSPVLEIEVNEGNVRLETKDIHFSAKQLQVLKEHASKKVKKSPFSHGGTFSLKIKGKEVIKLQSRLNELNLSVAEDLDESMEDIFEDFRFSSRLHKGKDGKKKVLIGKNFTIGVGESVDELVVIGSVGKIAGQVRKLVAIGSSVDIASTAKITEEFIALGSTVDRHPKAQIEAQEVSILVPTSAAFWSSVASVFHDWDDEGKSFSCGCYLWWSIGLFLLALAFGALYLHLFPNFHAATTQYFTQNWAASFGIGVLGHILAVPLALCLVITVIGIPLVPLYFLLLSVLAAFGYVTIAYVLGNLLPFKTKLIGLKAYVLGLIILWAVWHIPYLGFWLIAIPTTAGFGTVIRTLLQKLRKKEC